MPSMYLNNLDDEQTPYKFYCKKVARLASIIVATFFFKWEGGNNDNNFNNSCEF